MKFLILLFIFLNFSNVIKSETNVNVEVGGKCLDSENNEGICSTLLGCEHLRRTFEDVSITPLLSNQLFWTSNCIGYNICCSFNQTLPEYVTELIKKLPQPSDCGKDFSSLTQNRQRREVTENENSLSDDGVCMSVRDCQRLSRIFTKKHDSRMNQDCGENDICCVLDTRFFNESFTKCSDEDSHPSVGGDATKVDEFPWTVTLQYVNPENTEKNTSFCSGSLINSRYVLTAAHCVVGKPNLQSIKIGEYDVTTEVDCDEDDTLCAEERNDQEIFIEEKIVHEDYDSNSSFNDIALIRLQTEAKFGRFVQPICLPWSYPKKLDDMIYVAAGWGNTTNIFSYGIIIGYFILGRTETNKMSNVKRKVELPHINFETCRETAESRNRQIRDSQICAGGLEWQDTCRGDSGGPLIAKSSQPVELLGITSFGWKACGRLGIPGFYTKVTSYLEWISRKIRD